MYKPSLILALFCVISNVFAAWPSNLLPGWKVESVVDQMRIMATDFAFLGNDPSKILVIDKKGLVLLYDKGVRKVFLDIRDLVGRATGDRGLLEIVVDPKFPERPYIYLGYVYDNNATDLVTPKIMRVSRFTADWETAEKRSQKILLGLCKDKEFGWYGHECMPMVGTTHSTGWMGFSDDGKLFVATGDGQTFDGKDWLDAQRYTPTDFNGPMEPSFLGGKMLRIDPDVRNPLISP
jgi:glucose/arabinose dehydrogenase